MADVRVSRENEQIPQVRRSRHRSTTPEGRNESRALMERRRLRALFTRAYRDAARTARLNRNSPRGNFQDYSNMSKILQLAKSQGVLVGGVDRAKRIEQQVLRERALEKELGLGKMKLHQSLAPPAMEAPEPQTAVQVSVPEERPQHTAYADPSVEDGQVYGEVPDPLNPVFDRARSLYTRGLFG